MKRWLLIVAVPIAVLLCTAVASTLLMGYERWDTEQRRMAAAQAGAATFREHVDTVVSRLSTTGGLFAASSAVTELEFRQFTKTLLREPAIKTVSYIDRVPAAQRAAFERRTGLPIVDGGDKDAKRVPPRREYYPYMLAGTVPKSPRVNTPDAAGEPVRALALRRARDTGQAQTTAPVTSFRDKTRVLLVFVPVYRGALPPPSVTERRRTLRGYTVGILPLDRLLPRSQARSVTLNDSGRRIAGARRLENPTTVPVVLAGRRFELQVGSRSAPDYAMAVAVAVGGMVLALMIGIVLAILLRRNAYAEGLVRERMVEQYRLEEQLRRLVVEDALTRLPNRRGLFERLEAELAASRRYGGGALLLIDLDEFKQVNDTLGHPAGDKVLCRVADVLRTRARESDHVARIGGDEFVVLLPRVDEEGAATAGEGILAGLRQDPALRELFGHPARASLGIAMMTGEPGRSAERLLMNADQSMYAAKRTGGNRCASGGVEGEIVRSRVSLTAEG